MITTLIFDTKYYSVLNILLIIMVHLIKSTCNCKIITTLILDLIEQEFQCNVFLDILILLKTLMYRHKLLH